MSEEIESKLNEVNFTDILTYVMEQCRTIEDDDAYRDDTQYVADEAYIALANLKKKMARDDEDQYVKGE